MKKKKWRDAKNALVMVIVMAAMLSTATYAWFTLTNNATVTGMQMTAGGSSGLKVSKTGEDGTWKDAIDLTQTGEDGEVVTQQINQVTVKKGTEGFVPEFYSPVYTAGAGNTAVVSGVEAIDAADLTNYVAKYEYYLKTEAQESAPVGLVIGKMPGATETTGLNNNGDPLIDGSFVKATEESDTDTAAYAVRIGLVVDGKMYIYEPNNDGTIANGSKATAEGEASNDYEATVSSTKDGTVTIGGADGKSDKLFTVTNTEGTKVTMYVWIEGTDNECVDQIKADDIEAQVQFTIVNETP